MVAAALHCHADRVYFGPTTPRTLADWCVLWVYYGYGALL